MRLLDNFGKWFGTRGNPINVRVVDGSASEDEMSQVEVANWPATQVTRERAYTIADYGYVDIPAGGEEITLDPGNYLWTLRNFDMTEVVFYATASGKMDMGIPLLPRNASRGYAGDGPIYLYANSADPVRVYYLYLEPEV